jgi:hypothetical protein
VAGRVAVLRWLAAGLAGAVLAAGLAGAVLAGGVAVLP